MHCLVRVVSVLPRVIVGKLVHTVHTVHLMSCFLGRYSPVGLRTATQVNLMLGTQEYSQQEQHPNMPDFVNTMTFGVLLCRCFTDGVLWRACSYIPPCC